MQNQHLMKGLEEFFQESYPDLPTVTPVSSVTTSIGTTGVVTTSTSSGNFLIKLTVIAGLIYLVYYLANNYTRMIKRDDSNKAR